MKENAKYFYISERIYNKNIRKINQKVKEYWDKILGNDIFNTLDSMYGLSIDEILFGECRIENDSLECKKIAQRFYNEEIRKINNNSKKTSKRLVFDSFLNYFLGLGKEILYEKLSTCEYLEPLENAYINSLAERIIHISVGTLIFEMYLAREEGILLGDTPKEQYEDFNDRLLADFEYVKEILRLYPCLERMIMETIDYYTNNYVILSERLQADYDLLVQEFCKGKKFDKILKIESSGSDSHRKGNYVSIIYFSNGVKVVYKPRCLKADKLFQDFQVKISSNCRLKLNGYKIIDREAYGWEEFVTNQSCDNEEQVKNYYYRIGMLIFCNYLLNVYDIHSENLIAMNEYPVIIDSETLFSNIRLPSELSGRTKVNIKIKDSVLSSGILPLYKYGKNGKGLNMSAINGKEGDEYPILIPILKDAGTSNMHFEYEHPLSSSSQNLVKLKEQVFYPKNYIENVCEGFRDIYIYVMNNKEIVLKFLQKFDNIYVRHLVQDTQRYSLLLHTSFHPDFLQDAGNRELFLCTLLKNYEDMQGDLNIVKAEIKDMINMDIPYFLCNISDKHLYTSDGEIIENYFVKTGMQYVQEKTEKLCNKDLENQVRLIKIVLTDMNDIKVIKQKNNLFQRLNHSSKDRRLVKMDAVIKLYKILEENALYGDDNEDVNWIGITSVDDDDNSFWNVHPLGLYLYEGISGIAIFYHALMKCRPDLGMEKACKAIDNTLFQYTNDMDARKSGLEEEYSGIFVGESSIIYTYEILYQLTKNKEFLEYAEKHAKLLYYSVPNDKGNDIIYGNAGAIFALVYLYKLTHNEKYLELACEAGDVLVENQGKDGWRFDNGRALSGFSHGTAGIIYSLSLLNQERPKIEYLTAISKGLKQEDLMYVEKYHNWLDNREEAIKSEGELQKFMAAWCHGAPGILLARNKMYKMINENIHKDIIKNDIRKAIQSVGMYGFTDNECLCHGNLGNTEILLEYAREFGDSDLLEKCLNVRNEIASNILNDTYDCARAYLYGFKIPGFMTGIAGMGYSLLRDINSDLPCILALEI